MEWVDRRLKQVSGKNDTPFGGFSLILIGDFAQLPQLETEPSTSNLLIMFKPPNNVKSHGRTTYRLLTTVIHYVHS